MYAGAQRHYSPRWGGQGSSKRLVFSRYVESGWGGVWRRGCGLGCAVRVGGGGAEVGGWGWGWRRGGIGGGGEVGLGVEERWDWGAFCGEEMRDRGDDSWEGVVQCGVSAED